MENAEKNVLRQFILDAGRATYASGDQTIREKLSDHSTSIWFKKDAYVYHDNYFGGEPFGGREVVFLEGRPIWIMTYYGAVLPGGETGETYAFLMKALSNATVDMPYRGPALFEESGWKYENVCDGDVDRFSGVEKMYKNETCVYEARYAGGEVDR